MQWFFFFNSLTPAASDAVGILIDGWNLIKAPGENSLLAQALLDLTVTLLGAG